MDYSAAFDILFLLAAVYFWRGVPGQQSPYGQRSARASLAVPSTPKSPSSPTLSQSHTRKTSFAETLAVPQIVLHAEPQEAKAPILRRQQHKRKSVSFSLSSMAELEQHDRKQPFPSPHGQHRPPTPFHRVPPTPSEILAMTPVEQPPVPRVPHYEDVPTPRTADMVVSKDVTDSMGIRKGWLV